MTAAEPAPVVAVFNASEDLVGLLREALQEAGFTVVSARLPDIKAGRQDVIAFLARFAPAVVVYDIGPPYAENWTFFRLLRETEAARGRPFVLTTTNLRGLAEVAGETAAVELLGKPYDIDELVRRVQQALGRVP